jgi:hypothetical protein
MHLMTFDASQSCVPLLRLADQLGIGDDFERERAVANAPREALQQLVVQFSGCQTTNCSSGWNLTGT